MKTSEIIMNDNLRPEYDLENLKIRKMGSKRKNFAKSFIHLEPDVQDAFPSSESVNEALRFLIRITKDNKQVFSELHNLAYEKSI